MVANITLTGTGEALDQSLNTIIASFRLREYETQVVRSTATPMRLRPGEGSSKEIRTYDQLTGYDVPDGVDIAFAQALADAASSYSPGETAVQVVLAGSALRRSADRSLLRNTSTNMMRAWETKQDQDGASQFSSFSAGSIGSANTVMSPGHVEAGAGVLRIGGSTANPQPAPKPWFLTLHPNTYTPLRGRLIAYADAPDGGTGYGAAGGAHAGVTVAAAATSALAQRLLAMSGFVSNFAGFICKETANISVDSNGDAIGAAYSRDGLVYVEEVAARMDPDASDKSMRGAIELNAWGAYTFGVYLGDVLGATYTFDASTASS